MTELDGYDAFLQAKVDFQQSYGFDVPPESLSGGLKPHQSDVVRWALAGGRRAIFADFGLGKTRIQLEIMRQIALRDGGRQLIVCPLGVRGEFIAEAAKARTERPRFVRRTAEVDGPGLYLTNYESIRDGRLDPTLFDAVSLDEAAVLRNFGSVTSQAFSTAFAHCAYRFVATATPSPNEYRELFEYAHFLGIMDRGQCMTRFTKRDSTKANHLTLLPNMEDEFWLWVASWALFLQRPSDLGYSDDGYDLPPMDVAWHEVPTPPGTYASPDRDGQGRLVRDSSLGVVDAARAKRESLNGRLQILLGLVDEHARRCGLKAETVSTGVLPEEPGQDQASTSRGASVSDSRGAGQEEGSGAGLPAQLLPDTHREVPGAEQALERSEPGEDSAALPGDGRGQEGLLESELQGQQEAMGGASSRDNLRPHDGPVRDDAGSSRRSVRDLWRHDESSTRGPLPRDRISSGSLVQQLQHGHRSPSGGSRGADSSDRVPDQVVIWVDLNAEQRAVERGLAERGLTFSSLHGSLSTEECELRLAEWRERRTYALILKPQMFAEGVNLQQCATAIFVGATFKFNAFIQACHRIYRFGQRRPVHIHILHAESERTVVRVLRRKWAEHEETRRRMSQIIAEHGLSQAALTEALTRSIGVERVEMSGEGWTLANNDTVAEARLIGDGEVDLIVTSIPFGTLYEYSSAVEDFGHTENPEHFWEQMGFLTPQLLRILAPGRVYACHVKDRVVFGNTTGAGYSTLEPFHAQAITHTMAHGFDFLGMITVVTDVVRENNQSYRLGWSEQCKDGTRMGVGTPEYVLLFRKPQSDRSRGYADVPVTKDKEEYSRSRWQVDAHGYWRDSGDRLLTVEDFDGLDSGARSKLFDQWTRDHVYDHELHVRIGEAIDAKGQLPATFMLLAPGSHHPDVWTESEVVRMRTLNTEQARRGQDLHVCPMPFGIVDRLIRRYSNDGDLVYDPFAGIGTVPLRALKLGRQGRGVELVGEYFSTSVDYLRAEEAKANVPTLFDALAEVPA